MALILLLQKIKMFLDYKHVLFVSFPEFNWLSKTILRPVDWSTPSERDMSEEVIETDKYLLALYEVCSIEVVIDTSTIIASP